MAQKYLEATNVINRLPWLFKILEYNTFFSESSVDKASAEIDNIMFYDPKEEESKEEK